ncbi:uncharacterized protein IL334_004661 [Kwoniella shivajii]|uniref:Uncharacterized protein n=1 Tax=Kwoniella shivajii TaxID=564305 RepID=A0ABZ1D0Z2_9TREE|nr:hypothetical protein IL334_004661 [Kwoniella shivajii]
MTIRRYSFFWGTFALSSSLGLGYLRRRGLTQFDKEQPRAIESPSPVSSLYELPLQRDINPGLQLPPKIAQRAQEEDTLIENLVLYLG